MVLAPVTEEDPAEFYELVDQWLGLADLRDTRAVECLVDELAADLGSGRIGALDYWMALASIERLRGRAP